MCVVDEQRMHFFLEGIQLEISMRAQEDSVYLIFKDFVVQAFIAEEPTADLCSKPASLKADPRLYAYYTFMFSSLLHQSLESYFDLHATRGA